MNEKATATKEDTTTKAGTTMTEEAPVKPAVIEKEETAKKATATKKADSPKKRTPVKKADTPEQPIDSNTVATTEKPEEIEKVNGEAIDKIFKSDDIKRYEDICSNIKAELDKVDVSYLTIAREFYVIRHKKLFQIDNYANTYDMAREEFGLSRATCNNYINICEKYGVIDEKTGECTGLKPEFQKYSSSQLIAMLQVPKEHLSNFKPEMSVREMKRLKEVYKEKGVPLEDQSESKGKSAKTKKVELWKSKDITAVLKTDNPLLSEKLGAFESEHPDIDFDIAITLVYKE